jgi:site-specific DNA-methyltransferase (adenine-specific)
MEKVVGDCKLLLGNCLSILPTLEAANHIISDAPYEDELHEAVGKINRIRTDGFLVPETLGFQGINSIRNEVAKLCVEKSMGWTLLFTLAEGVRAWRDCLQAHGGKYDTCMAWVKPDAAPRFNGQGPSRGFECIVSAWCGKGYRSWNGGGSRGVFTHTVNPPDRQGEHPTEKPLSLMKELVGLFTNEGDLVLDPFAGSFTTGVACAQMNRRFIGIEQDERYFQIGIERITRAYREPDMFYHKTSKPKQEVFI